MSLNRLTYQTLNQITVSGQALQKNLAYFQSHNPGSALAPVLKSNAYGHGLKLVAQWIDQNVKVPYLCVDSLFEAYELKQAKIKTPILIIGYTDPRNFQIWKHLPFTFPVFDIDTLAALNRYQPGAKIHLKIDTGMNRLGILPQDLPAFIKLLKKYPQITLEGAYSHLSQSDDPKETRFTSKQISVFKSCIRLIESAGYSLKYRHLAATAGAQTISDPDLNLIRLGLGFYGYSHHKNTILTPALAFTSHLAQVKKVGEGSVIGYGGTYTTSKPTSIAVIPAGYADGLDRRLSNCGHIEVKGINCPILGRVCMNMTIIDVSHVKKPQTGDEAKIISINPFSLNGLHAQARLCDTIPYDLLVHLNPTIKRVMLK